MLSHCFLRALLVLSVFAADNAVLKNAKDLFQKKDFRGATDILWPQVEKLDKEGLLLLARAHKELKEPTEMIRASRLALAKDEKNTEAQTLQGDAFLMQKKITDAKEAFKKAIEWNPRYEPAYKGLSKAYEKNTYELRILYQDMIKVFGDKAEYLSELCRLSALDGDNEEGLTYCNQASIKKSDNSDNYVYLGLIQNQMGDADSAEKTLKKTADKFSQSELAQFQWATFLQNKKNDLEAVTYFERCLKADSESQRCLLGLGNSSAYISKIDRSYEAFNKVCMKGGRKYAAAVRKAVVTIRQQKQATWIRKFEQLAEECAAL